MMIKITDNVKVKFVSYFDTSTLQADYFELYQLNSIYETSWNFFIFFKLQCDQDVSSGQAIGNRHHTNLDFPSLSDDNQPINFSELRKRPHPMPTCYDNYSNDLLQNSPRVALRREDGPARSVGTTELLVLGCTRPALDQTGRADH